MTRNANIGHGDLRGTARGLARGVGGATRGARGRSDTASIVSSVRDNASHPFFGLCVKSTALTQSIEMIYAPTDRMLTASIIYTSSLAARSRASSQNALTRLFRNRVASASN